MNRLVAIVLWTAKVGTNTMRRYLPWLYDFVPTLDRYCTKRKSKRAP
jgi:hypothetical protein